MSGRGPTAEVQQQDIEHVVTELRAVIRELRELRKDIAWIHRDDPRERDTPVWKSLTDHEVAR